MPGTGRGPNGSVRARCPVAAGGSGPAGTGGERTGLGVRAPAGAGGGPGSVFIAGGVAVAVASRVNLNYYAIQPGTAQSVQQFITVPPDKRHPVRHPVLLTDVEEGRVTALSYLVYKLQSDTALYPVEAVTGGTPPSQLDAQGALEMSQAEAAAKTAALRRLGYTVTATPSGAVIFGTFPGTPAYPVLNVGDVITAVDGVATPDADGSDHRAVPLPLGPDGDPHRAQGGHGAVRCPWPSPSSAPSSTWAAVRR